MDNTYFCNTAYCRTLIYYKLIMKRNINIVLSLAISALLLSCSSNGDEASVIDFDGLASADYSNLLPVLDTIDLNDAEAQSSMLSSLDKIIYSDGVFYAGDYGQGRIVGFSSAGEPLFSISARGRGPQEYLKITDFDVDENKRIVIMDGQSDRILTYSENGSFLNTVSLPFDAYSFKTIESERLLFNLAPWNEGKGAGKKLAIMTTDCEVSQTRIDYDGVFDCEFSFQSVAFTSSNGDITFNQPIDNQIIILDTKGEISSSFQMDFGSGNVPVEARKHIENNWEVVQASTFLTNVVYSDGHIIVGTLKDHGKMRDFIINLDSGVKGLQETGSSIRLRNVSGGMLIFQDFSSDHIKLLVAPVSAIAAR